MIRNQILRLNTNLNTTLLHLHDSVHPMEGHPLMWNGGGLAEAIKQMVGEIGIYAPAINQGYGSDTDNLD